MGIFENQSVSPLLRGDARIPIGLGLAILWLGLHCGAGGATTAWRILRYNVSGIEDAALFPRRPLRASARPFRFGVTARSTIDSDSFATVRDIAAANDSVALLVIEQDQIVGEQYYQGFRAEQAVMVFSVSKSALSLLIGMAIEDGLIASEEQLLSRFVPGLQDKHVGAISLRALLQMTSGIDYTENDNPFGLHPRFYYSPRLREDALALRLGEAPERRFEYRSSDAILLALALEGALRGESISAYTQRRLWDRLGMEHDGAWHLDNAANGLEKTGCCLSITARDLAKIGRLYLRHGEWNGERIVSRTWTEHPQRTDTTRGASAEYQYMWWRIDPARRAFAARGHLGQYMLVDPEKKRIVVRLGRSQGSLSTAQWLGLLDRL